MNNVIRLDHDATTLENVVQYYKTRSRQFLFFGYQFVSIKHRTDLHEGLVEATYQSRTTNEVLNSFYLLNQFRGNQSYKLIQAEQDRTGIKIITMSDCNIVSFLCNKGFKFVNVSDEQFDPFDTVEYKLVTEYYGNRQSRRSRVYLMNHIDEGLAALSMNGIKDEIAYRAFCLHPLLQDDQPLYQFYHQADGNTLDPRVLIAAVEYRNIANQYLSKRTISNLEDINLSPIDSVNNMLIADKMQNYKDFLLYHSNTHDQRIRLTEYFHDWLQRLNITKQSFNSWYDIMTNNERFTDPPPSRYI